MHVGSVEKGWNSPKERGECYQNKGSQSTFWGDRTTPAVTAPRISRLTGEAVRSGGGDSFSKVKNHRDVTAKTQNWAP